MSYEKFKAAVLEGTVLDTKDHPKRRAEAAADLYKRVVASAEAAVAAVETRIAKTEENLKACKASLKPAKDTAVSAKKDADMADRLVSELTDNTRASAGTASAEGGA